MEPWHEAKVLSHHPAAEGLAALVLDVRDTPLARLHVLPGQYVRVGLPGFGQAPFALASRPDLHGHRFELLLKRGSPLSDALAELPVGTAVRVSAPEGKGFPVERAHGHPLWLFATGSGISAIRSVVQVVLAQRPRFGEVTLFFGARTPGGFAYQDELEGWAAHGLHLIRTVSQPGVSGWQGLWGHVQAHLPDATPEDGVAFLCGRPEMVQSVSSALTARGWPAERIFLNY